MGLSEEEAWEKAVEILKRISERISELEFSDPFSYAEDSEKIRVEEAGLTQEDIHELLLIHLEENPEDEKRVTEDSLSDRGLMLEYLRLSFQYPDASKEELLQLFREAARNGETTIDPNMVSAIIRKYTKKPPPPDITNLVPAISEEDAREKAAEIIKKMLQRQSKLFAIATENNDFSTFSEDYDQIQLEETGITGNETTYLATIHLEENAGDRTNEISKNFVGLTLEYLRLSFQYPDASKEELLQLFREAARNGETEINLNILPTIYGFKFLL